MENENITAVAEGKPSGYKVTKKDLRNANWRWLMSVCTFNYQTQQGASVAYALSPVLRKIYTNDEDYKQALNNHFRYYNTQPWLAAIILGACVAMEERDGLAAADAVQDLKIGTMGPLAGVGDSLLMTMIPTIMGSIAAYMAIEGNPVGAGIWFALILAIFWVRMHALEFGYKQGVKLVTDFTRSFPTSLPPPPCSASPWSAASSPRSSASPARLASASATSRWRFSRCSTRSCLP